MDSEIILSDLDVTQNLNRIDNMINSHTLSELKKIAFNSQKIKNCDFYDSDSYIFEFKYRKIEYPNVFAASFDTFLHNVTDDMYTYFKNAKFLTSYIIARIGTLDQFKIKNIIDSLEKIMELPPDFDINSLKDFLLILNKMNIYGKIKLMTDINKKIFYTDKDNVFKIYVKSF